MAKTSITAKLGLDTTAFQRGLAKSQKGINNFVKNGIRQFGALAGAAGLGAMASAAVRLGAEISNLSKLANTSEVEFQRMAYAAKTLGIENEKVADILKDVSDKVGDFLQTGGGPMADFFENIAPKVGVTAEMFRDLSGKDALQLYVKSLEKANLSQNEMTFFMEAIASDATMLLPLLTDNASAMKELGDEAERTGQIMDKETIEKLKKASVEIDKFKNIATILTGVFLTKAVPALSILGQGFAFLGDIVGTAAANFLAFGRAIGSVLTAVVAPAISQMEALGLAIKAAGQFAKRDFSGAKESINEAKKAAGEMIDEVKAIPSEISDAFDQLKRDGSAAIDTLGDSIDTRAKSIEKSIDDITGSAEEMNEEVAKTEKVVAASRPISTASGKSKGKGIVVASPTSRAPSAPTERRRKFGESLTRYDPTTGEERKFGESFSRSDSVNKQQQIKDVMAQLEAKNASAQKTSPTEKAAIESAESLEIIKDELTRTS